MRYIIIILLVFISLNIFSQKIDGKVYSFFDSDKEYLEGANISIKDSPYGTTSNKNGDYSLSFNLDFPVTIIVSFVGYESFEKTIANSGTYNFELLPSLNIDQVNVKGNSFTTNVNLFEPLNIQTLTSGELEKAACCNLSECFETNSSVDVSYSDAITGIKTISLLGLNGIYTQITKENIPFVRGLSYGYGIKYIPGSWIESINIIKGSGSVVQGFESLTGQIDVICYKPSSSPRLLFNTYVNKDGKIENNLIYSLKENKWKKSILAHISIFNQEIDKHGVYHKSHHHEGDGFLDMPIHSDINLMNRWEYDTDKYFLSFDLHGIYEDIDGGQSSNILDIERYIVDIDNKIIELNSKIGLKQPNIINKNIGIISSIRLHDQQVYIGNKTYNSIQESIYFNFIRQSFLLNESNTFKYGLSFNLDKYTESFFGPRISTPYNDSLIFYRNLGIYSEYSYNTNSLYSIIAGLRFDYYDFSNFYLLPRLNVKYNPSDQSVIKISMGRSFRNSKIISENLNYLMSNREVVFNENLRNEVAWNYGLNYSQCFYFFDREGKFLLDVYRTTFENKIIVDIEQESILEFYNLDGIAYANTIQLEFLYEILDGFHIKSSYKINDSYFTVDGSKRTVPLTPKDKAMFNISYEFKEKVLVDATMNYTGSSRIPKHSLLDLESSNSYYIINSQITKKFGNLDLYIGVENLLDYVQTSPILDYTSPDSDLFDASLIYAPTMGRNIYFGIRWSLY
ncbi:MAG: hypothetical protein CMP51_01485 [Flavobacteriales bacterium]|nr:hypothetical protein [Flavobacteriales bacterium]